jgi:hypothetical protein
MSDTLHLYARGSQFKDAAGTIGLLCEFSPDSPSLQRAEHCYGIDELLGSPDAALAAAYPLVSNLIGNAPTVEGLRTLGIFEEVLLEQVSFIIQAFHLDRWIASHGFSACRFVSHSPWLDRLLQIRSVRSSAYSLIADVPLLQTNRQARALSKVWSSRANAAEFIRRAMPLWSRHLASARMRKGAQTAPHGGIWFYSTAYNFTKIGLQYEPYLPGKVHYLVEDPATGGKRLSELGREFHRLYAWSEASDIPSQQEVRSIGNQITAGVREAEVTDEAGAVRDVLVRSEWWHNLLTRRLPFAIYNNRVLDRWRRQVQPEMLVIGNSGWERALLLNEVKTFPVILLQHGIMHWTYAVTDQPVDLFLLRGPFFQRAVNERLRRRTIIRNFPEPIAASAQAMNLARDTILFISAPYDVPEVFHPQDLQDILHSLLRVAHANGRPLTIRVHPMESVAAYREAVAELQKDPGLRAEVRYSQGPGVEEVLARSCVAILFFSTMFLDCLRHGIPIVSFGWHWFPNKAQFDAERIFNFASSLRHFERLIEQGINGELEVRRAGLEEFLAPSDPEELKRLFKKAWDARSARCESTLPTSTYP